MLHRWFRPVGRLAVVVIAVQGFGVGLPAATAAGPGTTIGIRVYQDFLYATVRPRSEDEVAQLWQQAEHVLAPHDPWLTTHTLVVTPATLARLRSAGIDVTVEAQSVQQMVDESYARNEDVVAAPGPLGPFFDKVQPLTAFEAHLDALAGAAAGRAKLVTIGRSIEGRDIRALLISSRPDDAARASIIVTGAQHAREWLSPMVAMGIADRLVNQYEADAQARAVVDNLNVYVIPVSNPDGYVRTFNGNRLQRKNMRPGCNVDINRNFATAFGQKVSNNCRTETTSGPMPFSEPESRALKALAEQQTKLRFYVDYHGSGNQVMIPYAFTRDQPPGYEKNRRWGELLAAGAKLPARPAYALAQGQGGGSLDWFREKYTESLVVELPGRGFDPPSNGVAANVELQWKGWLAVAELVARENPSGDVPAPRDAGAGDAAAEPDAGEDAAATGADAPGSAEDAGPGGGAGGGSGQVNAVDAGRRAGGTGGSRVGTGGAGGAEEVDTTDPVSSDTFSGGCACEVAGGERAPLLPLGLLAGAWIGRTLRRRRRPSA